MKMSKSNELSSPSFAVAAFVAAHRTDADPAMPARKLSQTGFFPTMPNTTHVHTGTGTVLTEWNKSGKDGFMENELSSASTYNPLEWRNQVCKEVGKWDLSISVAILAVFAVALCITVKLI
jgi:hypothetical protein